MGGDRINSVQRINIVVAAALGPSVKYSFRIYMTSPGTYKYINYQSRSAVIPVL